MESVDRVGLECLYRDRFKPEDYVATYYSCVDLEVQFFLQNLHTFFSTLGKEISIIWFDRHVSTRSKILPCPCEAI